MTLSFAKSDVRGHVRSIWRGLGLRHPMKVEKSPDGEVPEEGSDCLAGLTHGP